MYDNSQIFFFMDGSYRNAYIIKLKEREKERRGGGRLRERERIYNKVMVTELAEELRGKSYLYGHHVGN